jgi:polar amino acid transport system substrate-binding protein
MTYRIIINIFFFLMVNSQSLAAEQKIPTATTYTVSTINVSNPALVAIEEIMTLVYARLGLKLVVVKLPAPRALLDANEGKYDGELYRVKVFSSEFPNLYRVPTSVGSIEFYAYGTKKITHKHVDWSSLKSFKLGAMFGIKYIEYKTKGLNIFFVETPEQLLRMLQLGRIDLILMDKNTMLQALKQLKAEGKEYLIKDLIELNKLDSLPLFHYLHLKNKNLIPKIDSVLQTLTKDGTIKRIWGKTKI